VVGARHATAGGLAREADAAATLRPHPGER
jgi:hypothetical protein